MKNKVLAFLFLTVPINWIFGGGLEVYLINWSPPNFTVQYPEDHCYYCIEIDSIELIGEPLIYQSETISYDWNNQKIVLSDVAIQRLTELEIPLQGLAVAFAINKEPIYGFWLWNVYSSFGCDRVFSWVRKDSNELELRFGIPSSFVKGEDDRFNIRIKEYLIKTGLIE